MTIYICNAAFRARVNLGYISDTIIITTMPSNLRKTTRECMYSVTYGKPMNIHSMPMALYNPALI